MASLRDADLSLKLSRKEGEARALEAQRRLLALRLQLGGLIDGPQLGPPLCVLFEGWDASGKGGCIRRLFTKGHAYVVFLAKGSDGVWEEQEWPFTRVNEDYFGERSLWTQTTSWPRTASGAFTAPSI